jgi:competence protein ComEC
MLLKFSARVADWHAGIEPSWRVPDPPLWLAAAFAGALILLCIVARRRWINLAAAAAVLASFTLLLWQPWPAPVQKGILEIDSIDVGQGDSLLLSFPQGKRMLVDGGGILQFGRVRKSNLDIGEDVVSSYLWSRGIRSLDVVVATHAHQDHIGGLPAVLANFRPKELWTGANASAELSAQASHLGARVMAKQAGEEFDFSGAHVVILSPPPDYLASKVGNNDSLAFRVSYGARTFLLTGDMERPMEERLLGGQQPVRADVLKVGHHGSRTSTNPLFLDAVAPSVAIISAGFENSFGHPHPDVLKRLTERHTAVLRTDHDGLVTISTDGRRLWFDERAWGSRPTAWTAPFAAAFAW